jgi:hypothetical protein
MSRPLSGNDASCRWLTTSAHAPDSVSTGCASAVTATVSLAGPIFNAASARSVRPASNCQAVDSKDFKPAVGGVQRVGAQRQVRHQEAARLVAAGFAFGVGGDFDHADAGADYGLSRGIGDGSLDGTRRQGLRELAPSAPPKQERGMEQVMAGPTHNMQSSPFTSLSGQLPEIAYRRAQ